ncbi:hypothetical protein [Prevotella sp.]|uniref:hypothetical protein n=1 Tax=Prevotella sp. TaxID=59823 RepID=UPI00257BF420|nr:hypothetical protein [Prevotella sp.]
MNDKAMKKNIALLSSLILTSCSMFNSEAPYKRFFSEKEYPIIQAMPFALYLIVYSSL